MTPPDTAIRARRKLTNRLIAAHEADRLGAIFLPEIRLITGEGQLIDGARAVVEAYRAQFADRDFITYERTTSLVEVDAAGDRAAEHGQWLARWRASGGETCISGCYLAVWRRRTGQWFLESELFVSLS